MRLRTVLFLVVLTATSLSTRADAAPLPLIDLDCGDNVTQSMRLDGADLTNCPDSGLYIDAPHVILDLNGHTVDGTGGPGDIGIANPPGFSGITIRNGTVHQFETGIDVGDGGTDTRIDNVVVTANTGKGISFSAGLNRVSNSIVAGNAAIGIETFDNGNVVDRTLVAGNGDDGLDLNNGTGNRVSRSTFVRNDEIGIFVQGDANRITGNNSSANGGDGIDLDGSNNALTSNTLTGNGGPATFENGIQIEGDDNTLSKNTATGNSGDGIDIATGTGNKINKNVTNGNGYGLGPDGAGLGIETDASSTGSGNTARGNDNPIECDQNLCKPNAGAGGTTAFDCGDPVTTSIKLGEDLLDCDDSGLVVDANNITINLNGHRISHDGAPDPTDFGIDIGTHNKVKVLNGEIVSFYEGIIAGASANNTVQGNVVAGSNDDGIDLTGNNHVVRRNVTISNNNFGINLGAPVRDTVSGNTTTSNTFQGINLAPGSRNKVTGNRVVGNGDSGIQTADADRNIVQNNSVLGNGNFGLFLMGISQGASTLKNTFAGNKRMGVFLPDGGDVRPNRIDKNKANANGYNFGVADGTDLGIDASGADVVTGRNVARGNDDPDECDPLALC